MRWTGIVFAALVVAMLAGCPDPSDPDVELYAITSAPVGRTASVRNEYDPTAHDVEMTRGVAVGVGCWDSCDYYCVAPSVSSSDEGVVRVKEIYRANSTAKQFVLIAVAPGNAQVVVSTVCAQKTYPVHVLED